MSGQTLNCVWWCNRRGVWCVESGSSCHRRNEGRENNGGVNVPGAFLVFIGLLWYFWWFPLMDLDQTFTSELLESFPRVLSVVMKTTFCQHRPRKNTLNEFLDKCFCLCVYCVFIALPSY